MHAESEKLEPFRHAVILSFPATACVRCRYSGRPDFSAIASSCVPETRTTNHEVSGAEDLHLRAAVDRSNRRRKAAAGRLIPQLVKIVREISMKVCNRLRSLPMQPPTPLQPTRSDADMRRSLRLAPERTLKSASAASAKGAHRQKRVEYLWAQTNGQLARTHSNSHPFSAFSSGGGDFGTFRKLSCGAAHRAP